MSSTTYLFILISFITTATPNALSFDHTYETDLTLANSRHLLQSTPFDSAWTDGGDMGTNARSATRVVPFYYNNKIFLLGSTNNMNALYEYDISTKQFTDKGTTVLSEDIRTYSQSYTQIGNLGYALGEYDSPSNAGTSLYVYSLTTNGPSLYKTITIQADVKGNKACLASTNSQLFVVGGVNPLETGNYKRTRRMQIYNLTDGSWETGPDMVKARDAFPCVVVDDYLYAIGGYSYWYEYTSGNGGQIPKIERVQITNILNNDWIEASYMLKRTLDENKAVVINQYIVLVGGWVSGSGAVAAGQGVQIIDTEQNTIQYGGALVRGLWGMGVINIDNIIYGFGGSASSTVVKKTWQYLTMASVAPTSDPTISPTQTTKAPTGYPTRTPTSVPSRVPSKNPTGAPTRKPTTTEPTIHPTIYPTEIPTLNPTTDPTDVPTLIPTVDPTEVPTLIPTSDSTKSPTTDPTDVPTLIPTMDPTEPPTTNTELPTVNPTELPTNYPTIEPTNYPTIEPTTRPTWSPTSTFGEGFKQCVFSDDVINGIELTIQRNNGHKQMIITVSGPVDQWFGYGFGGAVGSTGQERMQDAYAFVSGKDVNFDAANATVVEARELILTDQTTKPADLTDIFTRYRQMEEINGRRYIILSRYYEYPPHGNFQTYNFTSFMDCTDPIMDVISAHGQTQYSEHYEETLPAIKWWDHQEDGRGIGTIENMCCTDSPTSLPTKNPTTTPIPSKAPVTIPIVDSKGPREPPIVDTDGVKKMFDVCNCMMIMSFFFLIVL